MSMLNLKMGEKKKRKKQAFDFWVFYQNINLLSPPPKLWQMHQFA